MSTNRLIRLPLPGSRWRGLSLQLFLVTVLPLTALLLVIAFAGLSLHQGSMRTLVGARDERATRAAAGVLTEQLNHRASAMRSLALRAAVDPTDAGVEEVLATSDFLLSDFDAGIAVYARGGRYLGSTDDGGVWSSLAFETDPELHILVTRDVPPAFTVIEDPQSDGYLTLVAASAGKGGPVAIGAFSPASLARNTLLATFPSFGQTSVQLVDPANRLLFQSGPVIAGDNYVEQPGVVEALRGESGTTYLPSAGGERAIAFSPVLPVGWALVVQEPWESVASPLLRTTEFAPLVLVPALLVALLALWFGARQIVQPLQELESSAASLAWGDFEAIEEPVGGIEEIRRLQRALIHLARKVQSAQQSLRGYIGAITAGQEDERLRLARELHDDTLQALIALNQRVQLARRSIAGDAATGALDEIQALTEQTIQDLRRITRALRPVYLEDLGLVAALNMLARETSQAADIPVHFRQEGDEERLPAAVELALYRIAQEGLSNVVRHAKADQATLAIRFHSRGVNVEVQDDGRGFAVPESPAEFAPNGHFGLLGLHERAELIGAQLEIRSAPGEGTRLGVTLPQPEE